MPTASFTVVVERPLDAVRAYVADLRHTSKWLSFIDRIDLVDGEVGVPGSRYALTAEQSLLADVHMDYRTRAVEADLVSYDVDHPTLAGVDSYALGEADGGTEVTYTTDVTVKGLRKVSTPLVALVIKAATGRAKDDFKAAVERS